MKPLMIQDETAKCLLVQLQGVPNSQVYCQCIAQWIGFVGKILTGNPWVFTIKLIGLSG